MMAQRETPQPVPPAAPEPGAVPVHCRCGAMLGYRSAHWLHFTHRGRGLAAPLPVRLTCDRCGRRVVLYTGDGAESQAS